MIDTDATGQKKLDEVFRKLATGNWNEWEEDFIRNLEGKRYATLTNPQKTTVSSLYEKL